MKMPRISICLFALIACSNQAVFADEVEWSMTPMGCIPTPATAQEMKYEARAGKISFREIRAGNAVFTCPITSALPDGKYALRAHAKAASSNTLDLRLKSANVRTGAVGEHLIARANESPCSADYCGYSTQFPEEIDFDLSNTVYWVAVTLMRTSADDAPVVVLQDVQLVRVTNN